MGIASLRRLVSLAQGDSFAAPLEGSRALGFAGAKQTDGGAAGLDVEDRQRNW